MHMQKVRCPQRTAHTCFRDNPNLTRRTVPNTKQAVIGKQLTKIKSIPTPVQHERHFHRAKTEARDPILLTQ